jgi:hypothetical protein
MLLYLPLVLFASENLIKYPVLATFSDRDSLSLRQTLLVEHARLMPTQHQNPSQKSIDKGSGSE